MYTAQDLLEQWAAEKLNFNDVSDALEPTTVLHTSKTAAEIKHEWDRLTEIDSDNYLTSACNVAHEGHAIQNAKQQKNNGRKCVRSLVMPVTAVFPLLVIHFLGTRNGIDKVTGSK